MSVVEFRKCQVAGPDRVGGPRHGGRRFGGRARLPAPLDRGRAGHRDRGRRFAPAARRSIVSSAPIPMWWCSISRCRTWTASPRCRCLLAKKPGLAVIMASTLTRRNAEVTLKALVARRARLRAEAGRAGRDVERRLPAIPDFQDPRARQAHAPGRPHAGPAGSAAAAAPPHPFRCAMAPTASPPPISLRPMPISVPRVLVIGASTGGPQALTELCSRLGPVIDQAPVLVTQHMPPTFTTILAEHLARATGRPAREADRRRADPRRPHLCRARQPASAHRAREWRAGRDPRRFAAGAFLQAGGRHHVLLRRRGLGRLGAGCRADRHGIGRPERRRPTSSHSGGAIIAQDEATSVVWGMPGSVAEAGLCSQVLPLTEIAPALSRLFLGRRP